MRDLKHLIFFENLLDNADNELVEKAKADGGLAIGYTCFARALVERGIEGGFNFLDGLAGVDACSMMNRFYEHFELLKMNDKPNMFVTHCDMPYKVVDYSVRHYVKQMQIRLLDVMKEHYGVDISDAAIRKAVEEHNEVCRIITEIGEMRKAENPVITGYEFHVICLVSYTCPKALILPYLRETLEELKTREPDPKPWYRARVAVVGSEIDDPGLIQMIEEAGAMVVADRFCYGSFPGREVIELKDDEPALEQICRHYMEVSVHWSRSAAIIWRFPSAPAISAMRRFSSAVTRLTDLQGNSMPTASSMSR